MQEMLSVIWKFSLYFVVVYLGKVYLSVLTETSQWERVCSTVQCQLCRPILNNPTVQTQQIQTLWGSSGNVNSSCSSKLISFLAGFIFFSVYHLECTAYLFIYLTWEDPFSETPFFKAARVLAMLCTLFFIVVRQLIAKIHYFWR